MNGGKSQNMRAALRVLYIWIFCVKIDGCNMSTRNLSSYKTLYYWYCL